MQLPDQIDLISFSFQRSPSKGDVFFLIMLLSKVMIQANIELYFWSRTPLVAYLSFSYSLKAQLFITIFRMIHHIFIFAIFTCSSFSPLPWSLSLSLTISKKQTALCPYIILMIFLKNINGCVWVYFMQNNVA